MGRRTGSCGLLPRPRTTAPTALPALVVQKNVKCLCSGSREGPLRVRGPAGVLNIIASFQTRAGVGGGSIHGVPPLCPEGAGQRAMTPSEGAGGGTGADWRWSRSWLRPGWCCCGVRARGAGASEPGSRGGNGKEEPCVPGEGWPPGAREDGNLRFSRCLSSPALPRLRGVGGAQSLEGADQEVCTVVSVAQLVPGVPGAGGGGEGPGPTR